MIDLNFIKEQLRKDSFIKVNINIIYKDYKC